MLLGGQKEWVSCIIMHLLQKEGNTKVELTMWLQRHLVCEIREHISRKAKIHKAPLSVFFQSGYS